MWVAVVFKVAIGIVLEATVRGDDGQSQATRMDYSQLCHVPVIGSSLFFVHLNNKSGKFSLLCPSPPAHSRVPGSE